MSTKNAAAVVTKNPAAIVLMCSCGWLHEAPDKSSAAKWRRYHIWQNTPKGSRASESGHKIAAHGAAA